MQINGSQCLGAVNRLLRAVYAAGAVRLRLARKPKRATLILNPPDSGQHRLKGMAFSRVRILELNLRLVQRLRIGYVGFERQARPGEPSLKAGQGQPLM